MKNRSVLTAAVVVAMLCVCAGETLYAQGVTSIDVSQLRFLQKAQLIGAAINKHDIPGLEAEFDPIVQRDLPPDTLRPLIWKMTDQLGTVTEIGKPKIRWSTVAIIPFKFQKGILDLELALDSADKVTGFYFIPHQGEPPVPKRNTIRLSLPFDKTWSVMWGGDSSDINFHHAIKNQRYAVDFNVTDEIGKSHEKDGTENQDFFAWGKKVLAPADGIVIEAIDGVLDNPPFSSNEYSALGNAVIIEHSPLEYSVLSHLQNGSLTVHQGDTVRRGQVIGLCGNSGSSTEPHIEYSLQNTPMMQDATGVKAYFYNVEVTKGRLDPATEQSYAPVRGDRVENK